MIMSRSRDRVVLRAKATRGMNVEYERQCVVHLASLVVSPVPPSLRMHSVARSVRQLATARRCWSAASAVRLEALLHVTNVGGDPLEVEECRCDVAGFGCTIKLISLVLRIFALVRRRHDHLCRSLDVVLLMSRHSRFADAALPAGRRRPQTRAPEGAADAILWIISSLMPVQIVRARADSGVSSTIAAKSARLWLQTRRQRHQNRLAWSSGHFDHLSGSVTNMNEMNEL